MSRFTIYSKDGESIRFTGKPQYNGTYLKTPYLEFKEISSPVKIGWEVGDYVDYPRTGLRYRLYSVPQPKKNARTGTYGAAYTYSSVQLFDATKELEIALFQDLVLDVEKNVHFSTRDNVSTYEDVYGIAARLQASMDAFFPSRWLFRVMDLDETEDADLLELLRTAKEFSLSNGTVLGALNSIYNTWEGIGWIHYYDSALEREVILIGRPNKRDSSNTTSQFVYGLGKGLTAIKKSYTNTDEFGTRLYVYGSDRNLPNRYYNGKKICNAESVDIVNLMLPLSSWGEAVDPVTGETRPDPSLAYIEDADKVAKYGLIPRRVYFNGSDNDEIYPSVKNITAGRLRTEKAARGDTSYVPDAAVYPDGERMDKVKDCTNPVDHGEGAEDTYIFTETVNVPFAEGGGILYNSTRSEDLTPVTVDVMSYAPSKSGTRVKIEPEYLMLVQIVADDNFTVTQRVKLTVRLPDGSVVVQVDDTSLSPVRLSKDRDTYEVGLAADYCICTGTIEGIAISLVIDRERTVPTDMAVTVKSATESAQPIFFGFKEKYDETFSLVIKQIGFNIAEQTSVISGGLCTLSMKDGMCGGRDFTVRRCTYREASDDWVLSVKRVSDDSTDMLYPNADFPILAGDTFVLLDIVMPELYVGIAELTLLEAANALYADISRGKTYYEPEIDAKMLALSGEKLKEGMYMQLKDSDIVEEGVDYILIDSLRISEDESNIPTYKVTLREKKRSTVTDATTAALRDLSAEIRAGRGGWLANIINSASDTPAADDNVYSTLRSQLEFLSKKYDDVAEGCISFAKGVLFGKRFAPGITGYGGRVDGSGNAELDSLTLRRFLEVPELRYNRISINVGNSWRAPGGGIIGSVAPDYDADGNRLNTGIITLHLEDGEIGLVALDDICMGIYHDALREDSNALVDSDDGIGNFKFSGFYTTYFRVTEVLAADNSRFRYAVRPVSDTWPHAYHPCEAMHFVAYGNFSDGDRQCSRYSTRTYERYLKDVSSWEFTGDNIGAQFGDLSNLSFFGLKMKGYSAYLNNIYMSGVIKQFENLPYRVEISTDGDGFLAYGEALTLTCRVWKGWDDVTSEVTHWSIVRDSGDAAEDAAWLLLEKVKAFSGSIVIEHGAEYTDLAALGVSTLFTVTAEIGGDKTTENITIG